MARVCSAAVLAGALLISTAAPLAAQVHYQPQPRPIVTAENDPWFLNGEPITFEGDHYYPAGPRVFFNGNVMVRSGSFRGVPLYADTTQEPYAVVLVPLPGGLMQPYERRRAGDVAGSTGTQAPSFPVDIAGEAREDTDTAGLRATPAPPVWSVPEELEFDRRATDAAIANERRLATGTRPRGMRGDAAAAPVSTMGEPTRHVVEAGRKPKGLNEIYIVYAGYRWRSAGPAREMRVEDYEMVGDYHGHPIYRARGESQDSGRIFLEGLQGFVAPYEQAGKPIAYEEP
jgi:hypothetical protein